jgi:hypothetical protein
MPDGTESSPFSWRRFVKTIRRAKVRTG